MDFQPLRTRAITSPFQSPSCGAVFGTSGFIGIVGGTFAQFQSPSCGAVFGTPSATVTFAESTTSFSRLHAARCSGRGAAVALVFLLHHVSVAFMRRGVREGGLHRRCNQHWQRGFSRLHAARCSGQHFSEHCLFANEPVSVAFMRRGVRDVMTS